MMLFRRYQDNAAVEPWLVENEWCFDIHLVWTQWLFGIARYPDYSGIVWTLHVGPVSFNYYRSI